MGLFILLSHSFMGGFLLGYNPSTLPQALLGKETYPSSLSYSFWEQMRVLSRDAVSFPTFFVSPPSMPALLLGNPKGFPFVPG